METKLTRTQAKRKVRDELILKLWSEKYSGGKNKVLIAEEIAEEVDTSLTTVLRIVKPC